MIMEAAAIYPIVIIEKKFIGPAWIAIFYHFFGRPSIFVDNPVNFYYTFGNAEVAELVPCTIKVHGHAPLWCMGQ